MRPGPPGRSRARRSATVKGMTGWSSTTRFQRDPANGRNRRYLAVGARVGEGRKTIHNGPTPLAGFGVYEFTT